MQRLLPFLEHPSPADALGALVWEVVIQLPSETNGKEYRYHGFITDDANVAYELYMLIRLFAPSVLARWEPGYPPVIEAYAI